MEIKFTYAYKQSDEYKDWYKGIKKDYPDMPDYLIDMGILRHKMEPKAYQEEYKLNKEEKLLALHKTVKLPRNFVFDEAVKIYINEEDLPKAEPIKVVEY